MVLTRTSSLGLATRTAVRANKALPVPWMASPGKPRQPKPAYTKSASVSPALKPQSWTGTWVDPVAMFSGRPNFARAGKPKQAVNYASNKVASPVKKLAKKPWTGNLGAYTQKLVAKGKPYVAPDMAKAATTSSIKMPSSWIGSASDQLIRGTADAIQYVDKPTPKIKMWMTVNDPNGPWKQEKAIPAKATSTGAAVSEVVAPAEEVKEEVKV
uniref:Uncharacterized protein n=2 Tax=Lotharella globosa TaxID=91324 RepID=A0A7S3Z2N7_9EUKA